MEIVKYYLHDDSYFSFEITGQPGIGSVIAQRWADVGSIDSD